MLPYITVFGKEIGMYSLMAVIGLLACGAVAAILGKRVNIKFEDILLLMLAAIAGLFVGGHIVYGITNIDNIIKVVANCGTLGFKKTIDYLGSAFGGMVFYGGLIGAVIGLYVYTHFAKSLNRREVMNIYAVCIPLFHTFGRIGCFLGGCCYGKESHWGFIVHGNTLSPEINDVMRIPIQLIEAGCNLLIFIVVLILFLKGFERLPLFDVYILLYAPTRFILEFFRGDEIRGFLFGISTSQWISIILLVIVMIDIIRRTIKSKTAD